jgi:hypothetical protein
MPAAPYHHGCGWKRKAGALGENERAVVFARDMKTTQGIVPTILKILPVRISDTTLAA